MSRQAVTPHLLRQRQGGSIVLTSSTGGLQGAAGLSAYVASKHGVVSLMRTLALELAPHFSRVNTVHPTSVSTPVICNDATYRVFMPDADEVTDAMVEAAFTKINAIPVPWVDARDVSNAVLFLTSDESRYVTGMEMKVDAGFGLK